MLFIKNRIYFYSFYSKPKNLIMSYNFDVFIFYYAANAHFRQFQGNNIFIYAYIKFMCNIFF